MAFTNSFRMERVYFERLKSMIDILKPYLNTETDEKLKSILENSIDDNGAILLLYRNLGECWAELSDLIKKADEKIDSLDDKTEKYHDELNERIDEVNNYIMGILREIEARLEAVEQDLATLSRNIILDLERVNDEYSLSYKGDPVDFAQLAEWVSFPDNVIVRGVVNGEETVFHLREFDTDSASGVFEFFATGLINNVVHEITVTVLPDDSVNVATVTQTMKEYTAGNGINISSDDEISVDFDVVQEKLTAGSGISIDPDTHEIENTAQGKIYTGGSGILIDSNDEISNIGIFPAILDTPVTENRIVDENFGTLIPNKTLALDRTNYRVYRNSFSKQIARPEKYKQIDVRIGATSLTFTGSGLSGTTEFRIYPSMDARVQYSKTSSPTKQVTNMFNIKLMPLLCYLEGGKLLLKHTEEGAQYSADISGVMGLDSVSYLYLSGTLYLTLDGDFSVPTGGSLNYNIILNSIYSHLSLRAFGY